MSKVIKCPCGTVVRARDDESLVAQAQQHAKEIHDMAERAEGGHEDKEARVELLNNRASRGKQLVLGEFLDPEIGLLVVFAGFGPLLLGEFFRVEVSRSLEVGGHLKANVAAAFHHADVGRFLGNGNVSDAHLVGQRRQPDSDQNQNR